MRFRFTLMLGCALLAASCDWGGRSGIIQGSVSDGTRARLSDAIVVVMNQSADSSIGLKTDRAGEFTASGLRPGRYHVVVRKAGFQSVVRANVAVDANTVVHVSLNLVVSPDPAVAPMNIMEPR